MLAILQWGELGRLSDLRQLEHKIKAGELGVQLFHTNICTDDSEEFRAWELAAGIEARRIQLSRGHGVYQADLAVVGELCAWRYVESQRVLTDFALPSNAVELCIAHSSETPVWCGMEIPKSTVAIHLGGQSYRTVLPPRAKTYGVVFSQSSKLFDSLIPDDLLDRARSFGQATAFVPAFLLERVLPGFDALLEGRSHLLPEVARDVLLSCCQEVMDECFPGRNAGKKLPKRKLVADATDLIGSRLRGALNVQELLSALGVSRRVLERAFRQHLGVTPLQYLLTERLHLARRMLKAGNASILDICLASGFNHPSRFAEMYARQFGELPSQTRSRLPAKC